uniref:receptor-type tyrosine-protein phosphatase eta-like n=1 Tax=Styela clava TaxID=7725 RepID=UPI001939F9EE|nr:receptor-type tyrosine-protein phosphatase eta-like [Styela clava]
MIVRRRRGGEKKTPDLSIQVLHDKEEHVYANLSMDKHEPRSETEIQLDQLLENYDMMISSDRAKFSEEFEGFCKPKKYIATQGPLPSTMDDFWRMIAERKVICIVMLTKCFENGKQITTHMFHFVNWSDRGAPVATSNLIRFHNSVSTHKTTAPIVVHCSAGARRTGAFIAFDMLLEESRALRSVDVYNCVLKRREQRVDMVQSCDQYILVHKLLLEIICTVILI